MSAWKVLPKKKINKILHYIQSNGDALREIRKIIGDESVAFDEINCIPAHFKNPNEKTGLT